MKARSNQDQVIAWATETGNLNRPASVAAHFPEIPVGTIKSWLLRARLDGRIPPNLVSLPPPAAPAAPPPSPVAEVDALASQPLRDLVRTAIARRLARLALPINTAVESFGDSAKIVASLADRVAILEQLEPIKELDPTTEEGLAALRAAVGAFPPEVKSALREVLAS